MSTPIFLARGNGVARQPGNCMYREAIKENRIFYRNARGNAVKDKIAKDIIKHLTKKGCLFYHRTQQTKDSLWAVAPVNLIVKRIKAALREKEYYKNEKASLSLPSSLKNLESLKKNALLDPQCYQNETAGIKIDDRVIQAIIWNIEQFIPDQISSPIPILDQKVPLNMSPSPKHSQSED